jgi:DNA polymerase
MLVGEQPGDQEDLVGHPFIGPAGKLLDEVLDELGVSRESLYLTNAVKHFGFKVSGRRRLHERPRERHIQACWHWLNQEISIVDPDVIVCLGVTAASAVLGRTVKLNQVQQQVLSLEGRAVIATLHPAAILRAAAPSIARGAWVKELARAFTLASA